MSRNIRSLCNATRSNERYVPITGYRRQLDKDKFISQWLGHHRPSPQNDGHDGRQNLPRLSIILISWRREKWGRAPSMKSVRKKHLRKFSIEQMSTHQGKST